MILGEILKNFKKNEHVHIVLRNESFYCNVEEICNEFKYLLNYEVSSGYEYTDCFGITSTTFLMGE